MMDLLEGIRSRTSALKLTGPGPTREHIEEIIRAGVRAPDHGRLRPWRFAVLETQGREKLGEAMAAMLQAKVPQATQEQLDGERRKPLRAPVIIAVAAKVSPGKIPASEQIGAATAAAQNMLLAAHALGYGAMWKTGGAAYDANVKKLLGFAPEDHIVAFVYLGTIATPGPLVTAPIDAVVNWLG
jgi:nitroreductase